jgi:hypothetical protein
MAVGAPTLHGKIALVTGGAVGIGAACTPREPMWRSWTAARPRS